MDLVGVHIRCCGNGCLWFRPYGESLWQTPECRPSPKEPKVSPLTYGPSPRFGVPSLRHSSGGIALRLASLAPTCDEHDCVMRRCAPIPGQTPPLSLPTGRVDQNQKRGELTLDLVGVRNSVGTRGHCGSCGATIRLASDGGLQPTSHYQMYPIEMWERACSRRRPANQLITGGCTQSKCGSEPARESGLPGNQ